MIDYDNLEHELEQMQPRTKLFELIKKHLKIRGNWKSNKARGKPFRSKDKRRDKIGQS